MNFGFSDEQQAIQETAREMLAKRVPLAKVREAAESRSYDDALWSEIRELGWPGIAIPEEHGGQGLGLVELVILAEQLGYACAPTPFLPNALAGLGIARAGSDEQRSRWLPGVASGEGTATCVLAPEPPVAPDADTAAVIAIPAGDGAVALHGADSVEIEPHDLIDQTRRYFTVSASGDGDPLPGDVSAAADMGMVALAAELVGVAQRALEMAVAYAKDRQQFGRPIGAYQAVAHRCAEMLWEVEEARSLTYYAAWTADAEPESLTLAASMAKARASDAAWRVTADSLQVHGGIGFTWEHDLQFLLKRAKVGTQLLGSAGHHRARVAELIGLG